MKKILYILLICSLAAAFLQSQAESLESEAGVSSDSSDWDWSGFEAMDDTPISSKQVIRRDLSEVLGERLTSAESSQPDLDRKPRTVHSLFSGMPSFEVIPSKQDSQIYPCKSCHEWIKGDSVHRPLKKPHDNFTLEHSLHGKGKFWCFTCHDEKDRDQLKTLEGEYVDFEDAYIVCSQCHVPEARDWAFGAHGKRLGNWKGKRQVYNCTACHYQHSPAFKTRQAMAGPEMRIGLQRPDHWVPRSEQDVVPGKHKTIWQTNHE